MGGSGLNSARDCSTVGCDERALDLAIGFCDGIKRFSVLSKLRFCCTAFGGAGAAFAAGCT